MNIRTLVLGGRALTVFAAGLSLARSPDYPVFNIEGVVLAFLDWEHHKHENIMTFRDHPHRSLMTGTMAPVHHTPWLMAFNDSVESYVDGNKPATCSAATPSL